MDIQWFKAELLKDIEAEIKAVSEAAGGKDLVQLRRYEQEAITKLPTLVFKHLAKAIATLDAQSDARIAALDAQNDVRIAALNVALDKMTQRASAFEKRLAALERKKVS